MSLLNALREELRAVDTGERALRNFGRTVGGVLVLAAVAWAWIAARGMEPPRWAAAAGMFARATGPAVLAAFGAVLAAAGLAVPRRLAGTYRIWMAVALAMGYVMTRILLTGVYFVVVTPIGVVRRLMGHDPMNRRPDPTVESYWIERPSGSPTPTELEKYW